MTIQEIHTAIFQQLQDAGAFTVDTYLTPEIDLAITKAEDSFIRERLTDMNDPKQQGFQRTAKRADDLAPVTKVVEIPVTGQIGTLPTDYRNYVDAGINTSSCVDLPSDLIPMDLGHGSQSNPFRKSSKKVVKVSLYEGGLKVWGNVLATSINLIYIRQLAKVSLTDGVTSDLINSHQELVNLVVADLLERSESPRAQSVLSMNQALT